MAQVTSGSFKTGNYAGRYLLFSWTAKQSIADNSSTISWELKGAGEASAGYYKAGNFKVIIDGETVYSSSTRINLYNGTTVASGSKKITHNASGEKTFSASAEAGIYTTAVNCTGSASWELKTIARGATLTSAPKFNDEENPTITYANPAGTAATSLYAWISVDGGTTQNIVRHITDKSATSLTFKLDDAERKILRTAATKNTHTVKFVVTSVVGGTTFNSSLSKTLSIINAAPVVTASVELSTTSETYALTKNKTTLIKNFSWIPYTMTVTPQKEATIVSYSAQHAGVKSTELSGFIKTTIKSNEVIFTATDSRGNTTTKTVPVNLVDYFDPTVSIVASAPTTSGEMDVTIKGKWFNGNFGAKWNGTQNTLSVKYKIKANDGDYSAYKEVTATKNGNEYTAAFTITGLDYQNKYTVAGAVFDALHTDGIVSPPVVVKTTPVFEWGSDDFTFNVPVSIQGQPLADFVVEQGTSGDWTFRKWNSGKAECWCRFTITGVNVAENNLDGFYYSGSRAKTYPFTFKSVTYTSASGGSTGNVNIVRPFGGNTTQMTFIVCGHSASMTNATVVVNLEAKGTWK